MYRTARWLYLPLIAIFALALVIIRTHTQTLRHGTVTSGIVLLIAVLFLAAFHWRKKLTFVLLGRAATWLRLHIVVGVIAMILLGVHIRFRWPNGFLESLLFAVFMLTCLSGLIGLYLSITIPARLSKLRDEVIYERIPAYRAQVQEKAHAVVVDLLSQFPADTVADYYVSRLSEYFVSRRNLFYYLRPTSRLRNRIQGELSGLRRYCSDEELQACQQLGRLIDQRDDLDFHDSQQGVLKMWLFIHIGLTYVLLTLSCLHVVLVSAFQGSAL